MPLPDVLAVLWFPAPSMLPTRYSGSSRDAERQRHIRELTQRQHRIVRIHLYSAYTVITWPSANIIHKHPPTRRNSSGIA